MGKGEGKGRGGGGFFGFIENFFEGALECARCIVCCLCCWLISIPVLFIVGIVFLVTPSHRKEHVNTYNSAVDAWVDVTNGGYLELISNSGKFQFSTTSGPAVLTTNQTADTLNDNGDDIKTYKGKYLKLTTAYNPSWSGSAPFFPNGDTRNPSLAVTSPFNRALTLPYRPASMWKTVSVSGNSSTERANSCYRQHGTYSGGRFGTCTVTYSLQRVCAVVDISNTTVANSAQYTGCYGTWPSGMDDPYNGQDVSAAQYSYNSGNPTQLNVDVRSSKDPFIVALELTDGSLYFGLSKGQKVMIGFVLIGVSGFLALPLCLICYALCRNKDRRSRYTARFRGQEYTPVEPTYSQGNYNQGLVHNQYQPDSYQNQQHAPVAPPAPAYNPGYNAQPAYPQAQPPYNGGAGYPPGGYQGGYPQTGGAGYPQGGPGYPGYP